MAKLIDESVSLLDSALGPVAVTTRTLENYNVDDFVQSTVRSKAQHLMLINKGNTVNPLEVNNRPPVVLDDVNLGGYDGV